jgi:glycosyltransferase involved in cell wall biosynthesis
MAMPMRLTIVTPCFNAAPLLRDTIASVLGQHAVHSGRVSLQYLICDGASSDGTAGVVREFESPNIELISEADHGMYDALAKGLQRASGNVVAYLNAGDYYHPHAFDVVADLFGSTHVRWLTGYNAIYNERGVATNVTLPYRYRERLFACGAYGRLLPFVQQESTFWARELHDAVDLQALARLRYAGDAYLWTAFSRTSALHVVQAMLGGFRFHRGQLSEARDDYLAELKEFTRAPSVLDFATAAFDRAVWLMPAQVKKALNRDQLLQFNHGTGRWT